MGQLQIKTIFPREEKNMNKKIVSALLCGAMIVGEARHSQQQKERKSLWLENPLVMHSLK